MDTFLLLFNNIMPLYLLIALGYLANRFFEVDIKTLTSLTINIMAPVVAFGFIAKADLQSQYIMLPIISWSIAALIATLFLKLGFIIYKDKRANLLAMSASMGNTGFIGIPLAMAILPPEKVGLYILIDVGVAIYMATVLYYLAARSQFTVKQSLLKLARFPILYGVILGALANAAGFPITGQVLTFHGYFVGAMVICGMMILGVSLARMPAFEFSFRFAGLVALGKFVLWPSFALAVMFIDQNTFQLFNVDIYKALFLLSTMPVGTTVVAFAADMDISPAKAAMTVLLTTLLALFTIPMMLILFDLLI